MSLTKKNQIKIRKDYSENINHLENVLFLNKNHSFNPEKHMIITLINYS